MNSKSSYRALLFSFLALISILNGCSKQPWQKITVPEFENQQYSNLFNTIKEEHQNCTKRFDAEILVSLKNSLHNESVKGYLAAITPYRAKFIVSTPLGQPAYVATINEHDFQAINVLSRTYQSGKIEEVIHAFDLPQILKELEIGELIDSKLTEKLAQPDQIRLDSENRGVWYSINQYKTQEHLLIDPKKKILLERIVESEKNDPITISYKDHYNATGCLQPKHITVSGLSYGSKMEIQIDDILSQPLLSKKDFHIKVPTGFIKKGVKE